MKKMLALAIGVGIGVCLVLLLKNKGAEDEWWNSSDVVKNFN